MSWSLFGKPRADSAVVIDIASSTIGGAFVQFPKNDAPLVSYSVRIPIESKGEERHSLQMLRTLDSVLYELHEKGRAAFMRDGGSHPDRVYISVGAPWQETKIETETIQPDKPFVFTQAMLADALGKRTPPPKDFVYLQKQLVATLLNGYETASPAGKRAERADIVMLTSVMEEETMKLVAKTAKQLSPANGVVIAPFQSLAYGVLRAQYPHDKEFMLMRVSAEATSMLFADRGLLVNAAQVPVGLNTLKNSARQGARVLPILTDGEKPKPEPEPEPLPDTSGETERVWIEGVTNLFKDFATRHALPRILFLVAEEDSMDYLKRALDTKELHQLWLSDEPLTIIPVVSRLLSSLIKHGSLATPDIMLDLIVLYAQVQLSKKS